MVRIERVEVIFGGGPGESDTWIVKGFEHLSALPVSGSGKDLHEASESFLRGYRETHPGVATEELELSLRQIFFRFGGGLASPGRIRVHSADRIL